MSSELEPVRSSIVQLRLNNRVYDMVQSSRCGTCMHPARFEIEAMILQNWGYPAISKFVSDKNKTKRDGSIIEWPELTPAQIRNHYQAGHCPVKGEVQRELARQRAEKRGIDLDESMGQYVDHVIVQTAVMRRGLELLEEGKIEPDVKDLLAASKLLQDQEEQAEGSTVEQWQEFMEIYFSAVQRVVSQDQWDEIKFAIQSHPAMQAMNASNNATTTIDAEVIEDGN